jgi:hypothetical protein
MDKIITLLQSLLSLNKVASVSVPGLVAAVGLAILLWPPRPIDQIPCVVSQTTNQLQVANQPCSITAPAPTQRACIPGTQTLPAEPWYDKQAARDTQKILDQEQQAIAECIEKETSLKGLEKTENDYWTQDIADLQKLSTAALETYSNYEKTNNPLAGQFRAKWEYHLEEIEAKRKSILQNEQRMRDRDRYLAELARYDKTISERLADPGRLRPRKTFEDVLAALVNHVVAFILLAIALGVILTPLNQTASAGFFDRLFRPQKGGF